MPSRSPREQESIQYAIRKKVKYGPLCGSVTKGKIYAQGGREKHHADSTRRTCQAQGNYILNAKRYLWDREAPSIKASGNQGETGKGKKGELPTLIDGSRIVAESCALYRLRSSKEAFKAK